MATASYAVNEEDSSEKSKLAQMCNEEILCMPIEDVLSKLNSSQSGLTSEEARKLLDVYGRNEVARKKRRAGVFGFALRFRNPLVVILLVAGVVSGLFGELTDSIIIFLIVLMSVILDFFQENRAEKAAEELKERVATTATVLRDGVKKEVRLSEVVPGDIIFLSAGDIVPADARVVSSKDFFIDQSALTGESFPAEKTSVPIKPEDVSTIGGWVNYLFMGTSVVSGSATAVVVKTGGSTEYGKLVKLVVERRPETEFERGLRRFGYMIMEVTLFLVFFVFIGRVFFLRVVDTRVVLDSLLFAIALAVGLTPELLPMILSLNLSKGAIAMSKKGVIVKRLASIQNFGSMDVLCTDKTGTLTENKVKVILHIDLEGKDSDKVLQYSFLNSFYQTGLKSPLDEAILQHKKETAEGYQKVDEVPFDFTRRRVSVVVEHEKERFFITKGASEEIIRVCSYYEVEGKIFDTTPETHRKIRQKYCDLSSEGFRVLGICYKKLKEDKPVYSVDDERNMVFLGFIAFMDPPKETSKESLQLLKEYGIELKILTGDNELVTRKVCDELGFEIKKIVLGSEIAQMGDDALAIVVEEANIFARVTPAQKDRIINALKTNGHTVGFLGDGVNDAPSMKVADVSVSVNNAVDVAKESADIILLHKDLTVLGQGVLEGRKTFGNTMKYVLMGISSNFGNMFSAAAASLFLNFLPMLPKQILLNNLLYDLSESTIPTDNVDEEYIEKPKRLDVTFIRDYMIYFGPVSSLFDFLTFYIMLYVFNAWNNAPLFQTAWFIESLCTQTLVIFAIRTRRFPFYKSTPSKPLLISSLTIVAISILIPFTPIGGWFQFVVLPITFFAFLAAFVGAYLAMVEILKWFFYKRYAHRLEQTMIPKKPHILNVVNKPNLKDDKTVSNSKNV
ncbi:MAG TPA: magnesium-translocating P-type ATPase [Candidatus Bathyarchaeia archaeon]|nr:magnesium-translocating P-type ATPase [Candidatus Bathyarchaeia archaeon]